MRKVLLVFAFALAYTALAFGQGTVYCDHAQSSGWPHYQAQVQSSGSNMYATAQNCVDEMTAVGNTTWGGNADWIVSTDTSLEGDIAWDQFWYFRQGSGGYKTYFDNNSTPTCTSGTPPYVTDEMHGVLLSNGAYANGGSWIGAFIGTPQTMFPSFTATGGSGVAYNALMLIEKKPSTAPSLQGYVIIPAIPLPDTAGWNLSIKWYPDGNVYVILQNNTTGGGWTLTVAKDSTFDFYDNREVGVMNIVDYAPGCSGANVVRKFDTYEIVSSQ